MFFIRLTVEKRFCYRNITKHLLIDKFIYYLFIILSMDDNKYESYEEEINPKTMLECRSKISKLNTKLTENLLKQIQKKIEMGVLKADEVKLEKRLAILSKKAELLFGDPMVAISCNTRYNKRHKW